MVAMFRASKAKEISEFFDVSLEEDEVAIYFLGTSGIIARTSQTSVIFDPAGMLKKDEIATAKPLELVLFTHDHLDHFNGRDSKAIFEASNAQIVAEAKVADKLKGQIPVEKLVSA